MSDTLKKELEELDRFRREKPANDKLLEKLKALESKETEFHKIENEKYSLKLERQAFEIDKREYKIKVLEAKYSDVLSLMNCVFRNQRLVHRTVSNDTFPVNNNGYHTTTTGVSTSETEITEE